MFFLANLVVPILVFVCMMASCLRKFVYKMNSVVVATGL